MPAYVIANIHVKDPEGYQEYVKLSGPALAAHGGRFVVRGGDTIALEGDWNTGRLIVLEFPDSSKAREWWNSPDYVRARKIREKTAVTDMVVVEGA
jgi:uncharacterized protein (DUF1330 family)